MGRETRLKFSLPPRNDPSDHPELRKVSKVKPTRSILTWDELRSIEGKWKSLGGPAATDIQKLMRHIRFIEHMNGILADQLQENKKVKKAVHVTKEKSDADA